MGLANIDELKQREIVRLAELKRGISETTRDLERFNKSKEEIGEELKELAFYRDKNKKQYQKELLIKRELENEIEKIQNNLHKLETQRKEIIEQLDEETLEKIKNLNNFKNSKKDFVRRLKNQEKELQRKQGEIEQQAIKLSREQTRLAEKENLLENGLISAQEREKVANALQVRLNRLQEQVQHRARTTKENLDKTGQIRQEKEQELKKQQEITKSLENKLKILNLKIEAQDRREAPIRKLEQELKKKELKLIDDRQSLQRAWAEVKGGR